MGVAKKILKALLWTSGVLAAAVVFLAIDAWKIIAVKRLGYAWGTVLSTVVTTLLAWAVIWLSNASGAGSFAKKWIEEKKAGLSERAQKAVKVGQPVIIINTAILLGPVVASLLMLVLGIRRWIYGYAFLAALLCQAIWCGVYSGAFWGIEKMLRALRF